MDSGNNSNSFQSSSGGEEEFDSRTFFANTTNNNNINNNNNFSFLDTLSFIDPSSTNVASRGVPPPENPIPYKTPPALAPAPASRSSKKRSRASRRAPTTVLTTDTTNFRAMVQEFTGIPAPPFAAAGQTHGSSSSSFLPRSRFDFLNSPSFLLKPKFQYSNLNASSNAMNNGSGSGSYSTSNNFNHPLPSSSNLGPGLNLQSLMQSKSQQTGSLMMPTTSADYGLANLGHPGLIGSGWSQDAAVDPTQLRQAMETAANYNSSNMSSKVNSSCKLNFSASGSTEPGTEKGGGGGEARGEGGMLESWICSSD